MHSTAPKKPSKRKTPVAKAQPAPSLSGTALSTYLLALAARAATALTAAQACKQAKGAGHLVSPAEVEQAFEHLVRNERLYRHPGAGRTAKTTHGYWRESATDFVQQRLQQQLAANPQNTLTQLRAAVPKEYRAALDAAIAALLREGQLFEKPGGKAKTYTTTPLPATSLLTAAQRKTLQGMLDKLNALRSQPLQLAELLQFLDGNAPTASNGLSAVAAAAAATPTLALLGELYRLDLPGRGGLSSMPIPFTWRRYAQQSNPADRAAFEQLLLDSAAAGRVELIAHEWPATLAAEDLAAAIRQPGGRVLYYWRPLE